MKELLNNTHDYNSSEPNRWGVIQLSSGKEYQIKFDYAGDPSLFSSKVAADLIKLQEKTNASIVEWGPKPKVIQNNNLEHQATRPKYLKEFDEIIGNCFRPRSYFISD
jgi:hypothetical protein